MVHEKREANGGPEAKDHHDESIGGKARPTQPILCEMKDDLVREIDILSGVCRSFRGAENQVPVSQQKKASWE